MPLSWACPIRDSTGTHKAGYISKSCGAARRHVEDVQREADHRAHGTGGHGGQSGCHEEVPQGHRLPNRGVGAVGGSRRITQIKDPSVLDPKIIAFNTDGEIPWSDQDGCRLASGSRGWRDCDPGERLVLRQGGESVRNRHGDRWGHINPPILMKGGGGIHVLTFLAGCIGRRPIGTLVLYSGAQWRA